MGGGSEIIAALGWSWVVAAKLWLVMDGGSEVIAALGWPGWWQQNYGWSLLVVDRRTI